MEYNISNIVVASDLSQEVDKEQINELFGDRAEYNPDDFPAVMIGKSEEGPTILLYKDNIISTGGTDVDNPLESIDRLSSNLPEGIECENPYVCNIVGTFKLGRELNLPVVSIGLGLEYNEYEPEQFPSIIYKPEGEDFNALIFSSGSVVITGSNKTEEEVVEAYKIVRDNLNDIRNN